MAHQSLWKAGFEAPRFDPLTESFHVDVCVVGAGIAGLSVAYALARAGRRVAVVAEGPLGAGMTGMTTAHLTNMLDDRYFELEKLHGRDAARLAAESHGAAIDFIEEAVQRESIDCDFLRLDGYLFLAAGDRRTTLEREHAAAHRAGLHGVALLGRAPLEAFDTGPCLRFPNVAQFHPLKYLAGLARAIERLGGRIHTGVRVERIEGGTPALAQAGDHTVTGDAVVVATNTPINDRVAIHTKQAPYMTYVIAMRMARPPAPFLAWDTGDPYHYLRTAGDLLIVGGEDHKTGQADDTAARYARLEAWTRARFGAGEVAFAWAGQVMETIDYLAFTGHNPLDERNVYVHTGDSGMGLTHGAIAGMLIRDQILGVRNPWEKLYDPGRIPVGAAATYAAENLNVARQYGEWLTPGDVDSVAQIAPGSGAIVRRGLEKIAAYRDPQGRLHELDAACPHLGCVVHWNAAETTWDCPCHGSRFDACGKVINGPANTDLASAERAPDQRAA